jgi:hypothetical protein
MLSALILVGLGAAAPHAQDDRDYDYEITVEPGDTLALLAEEYLGNQNYWPQLWAYNRDRMKNPSQLTVGETLLIPPSEDIEYLEPFPPTPPEVEASLYDRGEPLKMGFPKYFSFMADPDGIGDTGVKRIKVNKLDPISLEPVSYTMEVREVGEILSTMDRGKQWYFTGQTPGKLLITFNDEVMVRFTEDLAMLLSSAAHAQPDPYFREFPIYGLGEWVPEPNPARADYGQNLGQLHEYKGRLKVVARVEPTQGSYRETVEDRAFLFRRGIDMRPLKGRNQDAEPVSYVAKIIYSEEPINIGDKLYLFRKIYPGPDHRFGDGPIQAGPYHSVPR